MCDKLLLVTVDRIGVAVLLIPCSVGVFSVEANGVGVRRGLPPVLRNANLCSVTNTQIYERQNLYNARFVLVTFGIIDIEVWDVSYEKNIKNM